MADIQKTMRHIIILILLILIGSCIPLVHESSAQISCPGFVSTKKSPNGEYKVTAFGCSAGWRDPNDNCIPSDQPPECGNRSGPECEEYLDYYAANVDVFGSNKKILVTRPDTGKSVVVITIDTGPHCSREQLYGPILDLSYAAATYLGPSGGNYEKVLVKEVSDSTKIGPSDGSVSAENDTSGSQSTGGGQTSAVSNYCLSEIGDVKEGDDEEIALGCDFGLEGGGGGGFISGNYVFPLDPDQVTGVASEMAAYPGSYTYGGHREHAGLDIGAPVGRRIPVYAVADGIVSSARESCYIRSQGSSCRIDISHTSDDAISSYTHVDVLSNVKSGGSVKKGQVIANVHHWLDIPGMDHLHFEMQSKTKLDSLGVPVNINPRNHMPVLQRWKPNAYGGTGNSVRQHTSSAGLPWQNDGREFAEMYQYHPPCRSNPGGCWAH